MSDSKILIAAFFDALQRSDLDTAMESWALDSRYVLHLSQELLPFAGPTDGRENIRRQFKRMQEDWEYLLFRPGLVRNDPEDPSILHCRHEFLYRHRASGEDIAGRCRFVWRVENGMIVSCEEFHDRGRMEAFLRLVGLGG